MKYMKQMRTTYELRDSVGDTWQVFNEGKPSREEWLPDPEIFGKGFRLVRVVTEVTTKGNTMKDLETRLDAALKRGDAYDKKKATKQGNALVTVGKAKTVVVKPVVTTREQLEKDALKQYPKLKQFDKTPKNHKLIGIHYLFRQLAYEVAITSMLNSVESKYYSTRVILDSLLVNRANSFSCLVDK